MIIIDIIAVLAILGGLYWFIDTRWKTRWSEAFQCPSCGFVTTEHADFNPVCPECGSTVETPSKAVFRHYRGRLSVKKSSERVDAGAAQ